MGVGAAFVAAEGEDGGFGTGGIDPDGLGRVKLVNGGGFGRVLEESDGEWLQLVGEGGSRR